MDFYFLLKYITPHRRVLLVILTLLLASSLLSLANPWIAGLLTASALEEGTLALTTGQLLVLWVIVLLIRSLLSFTTQLNIGNTSQHMAAQMRSRLYRHMQALPVSYYQQTRRPGETLSLLSADAGIISSFITDTLVQLLPALFTFAGAFVMLIWLDWPAALLAIVLLPAYFIAVKLIGRQMRPLSRAWVAANSHLFSVLEENLSMLPAIKAFTREDFEQARFEDANSSLLHLSRRQLRVQAALSPAINLLGGLGLVVLLWLGTSHIESGQLAAPQLVSLLLYAALMMSPMSTLANVYGQVQRARGSAERIIDFLQEQPELVDAGKIELDNVKGCIKFEDVSFSYPGRPPVLSKLNFEIKAGETIALTGENGVGKTTVTHLLMRFATPTSGRILIDNTDIQHASLASLRSNIGLVAQHVLLLNGTIADNIAYSNPGTSQTAIEQAARAATAHPFISALPDGYNTIIGDQGVRLSGGQRQRLSLARTLLKNPPILILDEATAMFDPAGEEAFIAECHEVLSKKTVILITHRPASLALADRILKLDGGGQSKGSTPTSRDK